MENEINNRYIDNAIKYISYQLGLPIDISIINVPNDLEAQNKYNKFQSTNLVKSRQYGADSEGIIAQVELPSSLPIYGSEALNGYPINIKISDKSTEIPIVFALIISHELSHVLLYSMRHSKKENEIYTDLTAIMQGFLNIFSIGRKMIETDVKQGILNTTTQTQTTIYGYLNDSQFNFACKKINSILKKHREKKEKLLREVKEFAFLLSKYETSLTKFKNYLEFLTKNTNKRITEIDGKKIVRFFQHGYIEKLDFLCNNHKEIQKNIENILKNYTHYTEQKMDKLLIFNKNLKNSFQEVKMKLIILNSDIKTLKKYVSYTYRLKSFLTMFFEKQKN